MPEPANPSNGQPASSVLGDLNPDELFARGMQSVKMTGGGGLSTWEPPSITEAARLFPNFEVMDLVGRGGMGAVYKARQLALDRIVAIKLLPLEVSVDRDFAERFKREARTMAKMSHPYIVSVYDFGTTVEGHLFFVMEYVEGTTLHHLIKTTGLKPPHALEIIAGVCEALAYAHTEGVVHRDIKPANVLVDVRGRVKVTDFGLARLNSSTPEQMGYTMTGTVLGTPDYMAPEQKRGMRVDHRADIYSLGVMLYEMLCGQVPQGIFDPPSVRVGVDERVDQVVIRAMQQEPDRRYQNTDEMNREVQTIRMSQDPKARAPLPRPGQPDAPAPKSQTVLIGSIAAAVVAVGAAVWISRGKETPPAAANNPAPESVSPVTVSTPIPKETTQEPAVAIAPVPPKPETVPPPVATPPIPPVTPPPVAPPPVAAVPPVVPPEIRPVSNPDMANAVAQISPTPNQPAAPDAVVPNIVVEPWREFVDQGNKFDKQRNFDSAVSNYEHAIEVAEAADPPAPAGEIARLHQRIGDIAALQGSSAEARGSYENAKRVLQRIKGKPEATQILSEIENSLRRLPRE